VRPDSEKIMQLPEAVAKMVKPGAKLALCCALEGCIPFGAVREIIRQNPRGLHLIGPISNIAFDMLIGAGQVQRVSAAWVGNVSTGIGYAFRRAAESGALSLEQYSNYSLQLALEAASRGLPMAISRSPLGSDLVKEGAQFKTLTCPHSGERLLAIRALKPDVTILHMQRADAMGNCQAWGALGVSREAALSAGKVIVTCEELVEPELIRSDPDRTLLPGFVVDAVCELPFGAHPSPVQGYYGYDQDFHLEYARRSKEPAGMQAWLDEWVYGLAGHGEYVLALGPKRHELMVRHPAPSQPVEYGW
jgi:glutaconate CoA-transferase subunit A